MEADLYLENEQESAIITFAGFAEGMKKWRPQAQAISPSISWMKYIMNENGNSFCRYLLVFPIEGMITELI